MANGQRALADLVLHTGWDATELKTHQLKDGTTYDSIVSQINSALGVLNAELNGSPLWSSATYVQDDPEVEYRVGASNGFERHTEYGRPEAKRAETEGHMLPLFGHDRMLGWTWDYLKEARMMQIQADIADAIKDARTLYRTQLLGRVLKRGDDSGKANGLGTTGLSAGFATAAASTGVDFTPETYAGNSFTSDHEHYVAIAGGVYTNAVFSDAKGELKEHGLEPSYEFWISSADEATVKGLSEFTKAADSLIAYGANTNIAQVGTQMIDGAYYIGTIHDFAVRVVPGMPQYYGFGFKSFGANSQRNPLGIRVPKGQQLVTVTAMPDPNAGSGILPLQNLMLYVEFGVGVKNRINGTARYVNNATWADGTAS